MCACELHAPICRGSQAVWHYVNGNFCLLLCVESKLLYERTERRARERERNKGREGEIDEGERNRWSRWSESERDKGRERFSLILFLMHLDTMM